MGCNLKAPVAAVQAHSVAVGLWVERIEVEMKSNIWTYQFDKLSRFLKIVVNMPQAVTKFRGGVLTFPHWGVHTVLVIGSGTIPKSTLYCCHFVIV